MRKTRRALLIAVAEKVGGDPGVRLREALESRPPADETFDRLMSDDEFDALLEKIGTDISKAYAQIPLWFTLDHLEKGDGGKRA